MKNWFRTFYILFCIAGIAAYVAAFASIGIAPKGTMSFGLACFLLAPIMFFVGTIAYNVLKSFPKTQNSWASWTQLATGLVPTILFSISATALFGASGVTAKMGAIEGVGIWYALVFVIFAFCGQLIIFGLMPLLKGIQKTFAITPPLPLQLPAAKQPEPVQQAPAKKPTAAKATPAPAAAPKPKAAPKPAPAPEPEVKIRKPRAK